MTKGNDSHNRVTKWIRWIARIWSFPIILCALPMPLGFVAGLQEVADVPLNEVLLPIFMFLSVLGLGIAWRWEGLGGTITIVFQLAALSLHLIHTPITQDFPRSAVPYLLSMMMATPAILFLVCWWRSRKRAIPTESAQQGLPPDAAIAA